MRVTTIQIQEKVEEGFYPGGGLITGIAFLLFTYRWALTINCGRGGERGLGKLIRGMINMSE